MSSPVCESSSAISMLRISDVDEMCMAYIALRLMVSILMDLNMVAAVDRTPCLSATTTDSRRAASDNMIGWFVKRDLVSRCAWMFEIRSFGIAKFRSRGLGALRLLTKLGGPALYVFDQLTSGSFHVLSCDLTASVLFLA